MNQIVKSVDAADRLTISGKFKLEFRTDGPNRPYWEQQPMGAFFTYMGFNCGPTQIKFGIGNDAVPEVRIGPQINRINWFRAPEATTKENMAANIQFDYGIPVDYRLELDVHGKTVSVYRQGIKIGLFNTGEISHPGTVYWFDKVQENKGRNTVTLTDNSVIGATSYVPSTTPTPTVKPTIVPKSIEEGRIEVFAAERKVMVFAGGQWRQLVSW